MAGSALTRCRVPGGSGSLPLLLLRQLAGLHLAGDLVPQCAVELAAHFFLGHQTVGVLGQPPQRPPLQPGGDPAGNTACISTIVTGVNYQLYVFQVQMNAVSSGLCNSEVLRQRAQVQAGAHGLQHSSCTLPTLTIRSSARK